MTRTLVYGLYPKPSMPSSRRSQGELFSLSASGLIHLGGLGLCVAFAPWLPQFHFQVTRGQAEVVITAEFSPESAPNQATLEIVPESEPPPPEPVSEVRPVTETKRSEATLEIERTKIEVAEVAPPPPPPLATRTDARKTEKPADKEMPRVQTQRASLASVPSVSIQVVIEAGAIVDELPKKLASNPSPPYPADALLARIEGRVVLKVTIAVDGSVSKAAIDVSSGHRSLDQTALDTVRRWRFEPARRGGRAVAYDVAVPVRFAIRRG